MRSTSRRLSFTWTFISLPHIWVVDRKVSLTLRSPSNTACQPVNRKGISIAVELGFAHATNLLLHRLSRSTPQSIQRRDCYPVTRWHYLSAYSSCRPRISARRRFRCHKEKESAHGPLLLHTNLPTPSSLHQSRLPHLKQQDSSISSALLLLSDHITLSKPAPQSLAGYVCCIIRGSGWYCRCASRPSLFNTDRP
ncbi:hypothetical protein BDY17DRAFT_145336 [Neohortaea acidophila]|uniref:Uncharacterized protein n=1 Tax=Neohortaea acidophila TaxID=245834 RepID=A0A6A6PVL5_9PEZI|nr:uncharacterized protein BDY17DRAFT_145336 [Neohortaea acidophila]KAF2483317.1 hypothetical protein BDY17DRAFT_145336 [Neohortaea acidophila]